MKIDKKNTTAGIRTIAKSGAPNGLFLTSFYEELAHKEPGLFNFTDRTPMETVTKFQDTMTDILYHTENLNPEGVNNCIKKMKEIAKEVGVTIAYPTFEQVIEPSVGFLSAVEKQDIETIKKEAKNRLSKFIESVERMYETETIIDEISHEIAEAIHNSVNRTTSVMPRIEQKLEMENPTLDERYKSAMRALKTAKNSVKNL